MFVLQWHIVTVCNSSNHFVCSDTKRIEYLWRKRIGKSSISFSTEWQTSSILLNLCMLSLLMAQTLEITKICMFSSWLPTGILKGPVPLHIWLHHTSAQHEILSLYSWAGAHRPTLFRSEANCIFNLSPATHTFLLCSMQVKQSKKTRASSILRLVIPTETVKCLFPQWSAWEDQVSWN